MLQVMASNWKINKLKSLIYNRIILNRPIIYSHVSNSCIQFKDSVNTQILVFVSLKLSFIYIIFHLFISTFIYLFQLSFAGNDQTSLFGFAVNI